MHLIKIGYDEENLLLLNKQCLQSRSDIDVQVFLNQQSPDINQGVDQSGWRDWSW